MTPFSRRISPAQLSSAISPWATVQRWFGNKGGQPVLEEIGRFAIESGDADADVVTHLFVDRSSDPAVCYQIPLVYRPTAVGDSAALVAVVDGIHLYDGPRDAAYAIALLDLIRNSASIDGPDIHVRGTATQPGLPADAEGAASPRSRVLTGEQSNTSVVYEASDVTPVICKIFRTLQDGDNPDVVLQSALAAAGSRAVPTPVGYLAGRWADPQAPQGSTTTQGSATTQGPMATQRSMAGHLAFAQEFLPGVEDGWRVAIASAGTGCDFSREASELGVITARVHTSLGSALGRAPITRAGIEEVLVSMRGRLAGAIAEVPEFAPLEGVISSLFDRLPDARWPDQQRVHGDLHLGQVLEVPSHGWVLVDFEGEPLRPMTERNRFDSPLRDAAGMLHSFGYIAGAIRMRGDGETAVPWAARARSAYLDGYRETIGSDVDLDLVTAFELDKALYQSVYEVRNRPDWLPISIHAVTTLAERGSSF